MAGVTYDTGALIAGERNDRRMWPCTWVSWPKKSSRSSPPPWLQKPGEAALVKRAWLGYWLGATSSR